MSEQAKDWRGTPIEVGQTVIYGAPVGRSIALVEAEVDGFTDSGRVWLKVKHRAYGGWGDSPKPRVHVGADRLTVVLELPPTDLPLEGDKGREKLLRSLEHYRERLAALDAGEDASEHWREREYLPWPKSGWTWKFTQEEANHSYREYLKRQIKSAERKLAK